MGKMASVNPGMRITGASKVLQDDHVHEALQNKSDEKTNAQASFYVSDEDEDGEQFVSMSSRRPKKVESMPSPWMLSKNSITGETQPGLTIRNICHTHRQQIHLWVFPSTTLKFLRSLVSSAKKVILPKVALLLVRTPNWSSSIRLV